VKFLANENFPGPSVKLLHSKGIDIEWIAKSSPGIDDHSVMTLAIVKQRTILTHDSDYGELIFKHGYRPKNGVVYFRLVEFMQEDPAKTLLKLIVANHDFENRLTVIDARLIRERIY
jgi:predicted nuclease of predicted toxin-antitoxin system